VGGAADGEDDALQRASFRWGRVLPPPQTPKSERIPARLGRRTLCANPSCRPKAVFVSRPSRCFAARVLPTLLLPQRLRMQPRIPPVLAKPRNTTTDLVAPQTPHHTQRTSATTVAPAAARCSDRGTRPSLPSRHRAALAAPAMQPRPELPITAESRKPEAAGGNESKTSAHQRTHATESSPLHPPLLCTECFSPGASGVANPSPKRRLAPALPGASFRSARSAHL
jgi:hypothetical protein